MSRKARRGRRATGLYQKPKPGSAPGTIVPCPDNKPPEIQVFAYDQQNLVELAITNINEIPELLAKYPVTWINVDGLGDGSLVQQIGDLMKLHPLALEDVVHTHQRAKVEDYDDYLFIVARMAKYEGHLETEQLSMFLGMNYVLTFQENIPGDCLNAVRERLRKKQGKLRGAGPDYLMYSLLDAVIDSYFPVLERYGERLEELDERVTGQDGGTLTDFHHLRGELLYLRRAIWPHREAMAALSRDESSLVNHETRIHLRDCYDHTIQLMDFLETDRDLCSDLRDYYLSTVSYRLNEIMKVLTIIATVFMPLSFIAGWYGMNFDPNSSPWNMPELRWRYGYPGAIALTLCVTISMFWFFYRRGWLKR